MHDAMTDRTDARCALAEPRHHLGERLFMRRRGATPGLGANADAVDLPAEQRRRAPALEQRELDRRRARVQREQLRIVQT